MDRGTKLRGTADLLPETMQARKQWVSMFKATRLAVSGGLGEGGTLSTMI